ncbi:hypothetical protein N7468_004107 [Penicillium chermesinum]|uniref:Uncharacterized protein n=1 Tax=Penicillium chermesinum TaxID=63820 RepID=A0A9W9PA97_9EURO|nr:uncharacterized protein N7468_004107 [Penicillium chermesinum]KAJ5239488.1 hypothetical protein N7468_004107 [Penicillium chermesinum]
MNTMRRTPWKITTLCMALRRVLVRSPQGFDYSRFNSLRALVTLSGSDRPMQTAARYKSSPLLFCQALRLGTQPPQQLW